jgi:uncharacterized protein (DUF2267 family)
MEMKLAAAVGAVVVSGGGEFMAITGLDTFDKTVHETNSWIASLAGHLGVGERELAFKALRATLHALRDQLQPDTAAHLGDQLPILLRGVYYEGWHPSSTPTRIRHKEALLQRVRAEFPAGFGLGLERVVQAVFTVIWEKVEPGEVAKLTRMTPEELRDLWPRVARDD